MEIRKKIAEIIGSELQILDKLQEICELLKRSVPHFHWVGFYFIHGEQNELKLSSFAGKPTEHTIIPFGKGICGQVALTNENFVVQDVMEQDNYISCGIDVKSEIVVPIFQKNKNVGQIDIDSHDKSPFSTDDEVLLEFVCGEVARLNLDPILFQDPS